MKRAKLDEQEIIDFYTNNQVSVDTVATHFKTGKKRIREILEKNGIERRKRGGQNKHKIYKISD